MKRLETDDGWTQLSSQKGNGQKFWSKVKEEAAWTVWGKAKEEKIIYEIEYWGDQLDKFSSWTIPGMFFHSTIAEIAKNVSDTRLNVTNFKSDIMIARNDSIDAGASSTGISSFEIRFGQVEGINGEYIHGPEVGSVVGSSKSSSDFTQARTSTMGPVPRDRTERPPKSLSTSNFEMTPFRLYRHQ